MASFFIIYGVTFGAAFSRGALGFDLFVGPVLFLLLQLLCFLPKKRRRIWRALPVCFLALDLISCGIAAIFLSGWDILIVYIGLICVAEAAVGVAIAWACLGLLNVAHRKSENRG